MKIFINKPIPEVGMKALFDSMHQIIIPENPIVSKDEWLRYCQDCDGILSVGKSDFKESFFEQCPNLKAIALFSVGYDHVDIQAATAHGVAVGNTPDVLSLATSDTAFLLMQSVARLASFNFQKVKNGDWGNFDPNSFLGQELYSKTIGIYGLGRIGFEMAKKCQRAFDMKVIYHNRHRNELAESQLNASLVSWEELLQQSDVLSIHANYSEDKKFLFNAETFAKMKSNCIFINTARGAFVNEDDLYHALIEHKIWGAGLDVTYPEPMVSTSPLLSLPKVCVFPHIGSATQEARNGMAMRASENILAFASGKRMPYVVNPEVYL